METVTLDEFDRAVDHLRRFADGREVVVDRDGDRARVDFGSAHVELTRDGRVDTGMPLHEFESGGDVELAFDHDAGELHVRSREGDTAYTFRRP